MLYNPNWKPETKPDVFSLESLIAWLEKQPADKAYDFNNCAGECLLGQYMTSIGEPWSLSNYERLAGRVDPDLEKRLLPNRVCMAPHLRCRPRSRSRFLGTANKGLNLMSIQASAPEGFGDWLARQIGTAKWVVARKSKKRVEQGYELFLTQRRFTALKRHFERETGEMENDQVSLHLTEPDIALGQKRKETFSGMAFWASTGPPGKTCRECAHWRSDGYMASSGLLKDSICGKYKSLMQGAEGLRVPHYAKACKYFEEVVTIRPLEKPRNLSITEGQRE